MLRAVGSQRESVKCGLAYFKRKHLTKLNRCSIHRTNPDAEHVEIIFAAQQRRLRIYLFSHIAEIVFEWTAGQAYFLAHATPRRSAMQAN